MTRKLVIANQKGGVGKTTTVLNLGAALAEQGCRVLLVDLDAQGGLTTSLGIDQYAVQRSTFSLLLHDDVSLARLIMHVGGTLAIAPASRELVSAEAKLGIGRDAVLRLRQALQRNRIPFDYILIDTPPNLGVLTANGLLAADEVLIAVQCQYLAMHGVRALLETVAKVRETVHPDLGLTGILGTMYRDASPHSREVIEEVRAVFPRDTFRTVIPESEALAECPVAGLSVLEYAPEDPAAQAYRALAQEIMAHE